jgi:hypothetical protein
MLRDKCLRLVCGGSARIAGLAADKIEHRFSGYRRIAEHPKRQDGFAYGDVPTLLRFKRLALNSKQPRDNPFPLFRKCAGDFAKRRNRSIGSY